MSHKYVLKYDTHADVLYVAVGEFVPADTDEDERGLLLRFALSDGHPCGVTVLDFKGDHWPDRIGELSEVMASHLHVPAPELQRELAAF